MLITTQGEMDIWISFAQIALKQTAKTYYSNPVLAATNAAIMADTLVIAARNRVPDTE